MKYKQLARVLADIDNKQIREEQIQQCLEDAFRNGKIRQSIEMANYLLDKGARLYE